MATWKGQSRGTVFGYKIFVFLLRKFGLNAAYFLLIFVAAYYWFFAFRSTKTTYVFFRKRLGYSAFFAFLNVYESYFKLGQTLIDRVAIASGMREKFTFEFDGIYHLKQLLKEGNGGAIFTAHLGNINIAKYFFEEIDEASSINMVVTDFEHREIKNYLDSVTQQSKLKFIVVQEDMSHVFKIDQVLRNNEIIVFAVDRHAENSKYLTADFLGKPAKFFSGPYRIAVQKKLPVVFAHIMKEPNFHYHFYAESCHGKIRNAQQLLEAYLANLETMVKKYPNQWFNFYDYWEDF